MSQNKTPFFIPALKFLVFFCNKFWLCTYLLKKNFKLIVPVSWTYYKHNVPNLQKFNKYILKSYCLHWFRVSFKGKGFRLRKFKTYNKLTLNFGHSHWARLALLPNIFFFKKIRRQNYICFAKNYTYYKLIKTGLKFFKKLNTYTKRGLRLKKQYIKKRFGKISQVVSSLH